MSYKIHTEKLLKELLKIAKTEGKPSGFCIGNTAKIDKSGLYFTPIRITPIMVIAGVILYSEKQAIDIAKIVDGKVDYVLVDAEKKIPDRMSLTGKAANVERSVREFIKRSSLWIYKGNDLSVEAVDGLLSYLTKDSLRGLGSKKIAILGAGNLGCKLALKLVERGANVYITKRDAKKVHLIADALNYIKPAYTTAKIFSMTNNEDAANKADILIGMTQGAPVITTKMIKNLALGAFAVDVGKGTFYPDAIRTAEKLGIEIYRLDVSAAFEGMISCLFATENLVENKMGRLLLNDEPIVSGGLLAKKGEIVVDNVHNPRIIYGVADGKGDFIRELSKKYLKRIKNVKNHKNK